MTITKTNLRNTKAREVLLSILKSTNRPMPVAEILTSISKLKIPIDRATVYRTLDTFVQNQLAKKLTLPNSSESFYEANLTDHHHFTCDGCGLIEEVSNCNIGPLVRELRNSKHYLIKEHMLEFSGLCVTCQK